MRLRITLRKLKRERKAVIVLFLTFLLVGTGINFTLYSFGTAIKSLEGFAKTGNVELAVKGVTVGQLNRFGEVVNYQYFNLSSFEFKGKKYRALIGYGHFEVPKAKSSPNGVVVLAFPDVKSGDVIRIGNESYRVIASYYYPSSTPMILTMKRGDYLFASMYCNDTKDLSDFLRKNAEVLEFITYKNGQMPWMDIVENFRDFAMSFFFLLLVAALTVIVLLSVTHVRSSIREVGILKALGIPDSFISSMFLSDHLFVSLLAYAAGIPLGMWLGCIYLDSSWSLPASPNYTYPLKWDALITLGIILILVLPYIYVSRIKPINALRFSPERSSPLRFFLVFFVVFLAVFSAYFGVKSIENTANYEYPFNLIVFGTPSQVENLTGEKAGYLSSQEVNGMTADVYFLNKGGILEGTLREGRWFKRENEAVIGYGLAKKLGVKIGDSVKVNIAGNAMNYKVVGISDMSFDNGRAVFLPKFSFVPDRVVFMNVQNLDAMKEKLEARGLMVVTAESLKKEWENSINLFKTGVYGVILMIFIVSLFALFTLVYVEIMKNERIYATLKAIGIPNSHVWMDFIKKALLPLIIASLIVFPLSLKAGEYIGNIILPAKLEWSDAINVLPILIVFYGVYSTWIVWITERVLNTLDVVRTLRN